MFLFRITASFRLLVSTMVDEDKQACRLLAELGFRGGQWPESYITWDFLQKHPKAMEPGYLNVNWNHIPGLFCQKTYMRTIVILPADLDRLCDPAKLTEYWEPKNDPKKFHTTLALAFLRDIFHDCVDASCRNELVVSVAIVRKPAHKSTMMFEQAAVELLNPAKHTPTLLLVRLHRESGLFPDCYYHHSRKHFVILYDTGEDYNCGSPLHFIGTELLSSYEPGKDHSP